MAAAETQFGDITRELKDHITGLRAVDTTLTSHLGVAKPAIEEITKMLEAKKNLQFEVAAVFSIGHLQTPHAFTIIHVRAKETPQVVGNDCQVDPDAVDTLHLAKPVEAHGHPLLLGELKDPPPHGT